MIIYKVLNKVNGKIYIGQDTKNNPRYLGSGILLRKAIKKYSRENFNKEVIEWCDTKNKLDFLEKFYIRFFNSKAPNGYNLTDGGDGSIGYIWNEEQKKRLSLIRTGVKRSEITREKIRESKLGERNPMFGKHQTEESNAKRREHQKIVQNQPGVKKKLSEAFKGDNNPMKKLENREKVSNSLKGKCLSEGHKKKISEARKGKSYEEFYGEEKAKEIKENHSKSIKLWWKNRKEKLIR